MVIFILRSLVLLVLLSPITAFALGGNGATCNPSTAAWGSCTLGTVPFQALISNTVNIPAGTYTSPYQANQAHTRYVLQGDMEANSAGIIVGASYVDIDLNGHTITYNKVSAGEGVTFGDWNFGYVAVRNGSIIQGAAMSEGDQFGRGNSPVSSYNIAQDTLYNNDNMYVANLYVKYGGRDMGGIVCAGFNGTYEQNTIEDTYLFGTLKNRHQGNDALAGAKNSDGTGNVYKSNTLLNIRHRGIAVGNGSEAYDNHITLRSIATNSTGLSQFDATNISIHDNTIIGRGEHPLGVGIGGDNLNAGNIKVFNNIMDMQITALGEEYGDDYLADPSATYLGNSSSGVRMTWTTNNVEVYNNQISITTSARYTGTYSPTGGTAYIDGGGKGLFIGLRDPGHTAYFHNNTISVTGDGRYTIGVTCSENFSDALFVTDNTITTNKNNIVIGDDYGPCNGFPLFKGNTLIKSGSDSGYYSIANTYNDTDRNAQARFVNNIYQGGASESSIALQPQEAGLTDVYFGSVVSDEYKYSYRLHDNNNASSTTIRDDYSPSITLQYSNPGDILAAVCDASHLNLCTSGNCSAAGGYWYGSQCNQTPEAQAVGGFRMTRMRFAQ